MPIDKNIQCSLDFSSGLKGEIFLSLPARNVNPHKREEGRFVIQVWSRMA